MILHTLVMYCLAVISADKINLGEKSLHEENIATHLEKPSEKYTQEKHQEDKDHKSQSGIGQDKYLNEIDEKTTNKNNIYEDEYYKLYSNAKYVDDGPRDEKYTNEKFNNDFINVDNYTSCDEFVTNTTFDPKSVLNIDWKIFYLWDYNPTESIIIRFSLPSKSLVDGFRRDLDELIHPPVNWTNAELFMESSMDFGGLLLKGNISGLYSLIPALTFHAFEVPIRDFALKLVPPGYLAMEACQMRKCYALAPVNKMPRHDMLHEEAKKIGFRNEFGHSYVDILLPPMQSQNGLEEEMADDEEEEAWEIEHSDYIEMF